MLQTAFDNHQKVTSYYDRFNNEWVVTAQSADKVVISFAFDALNWQVNDDYDIAPSDVTATPNGSHSTASYNSGTGIVTYTPTTNYVGNDVATFTFLVDGNPITKNVCLNWIAGDGTPNDFYFAPLIDQPLSTLLSSNTILVNGIDIPVAISITGGEYSINGGAWVSTAGTVVNGDTVQVRQTSSATGGATTNAVLTIGGAMGTFSVTTEEPEYLSAEINASYRRNNCAPGSSGTAVPIFIAAGTYTSSISQMDADAQAEAAAQAEANSEGTCLVDSTLSTLLIEYNTNADADLCCYVSTAGIDESDLLVTGTIESPSGPLQRPDDGTPFASCFLLSSDKLTGGTPYWRFGINLAYFIAKYNGILTSVDFTVRGRGVSAIACGGDYAARDISQGVLDMSGAAGSRIPFVTMGSTFPVGYVSNIVAGADGTVGLAVGMPIVKLTYTFGTNAITVTTY